MKKFVCVLMIMAMMVPNAALAEEKGIDVLMNGNELAFDQEPIIVEGRVLVPFRAIFEAFGCKVDYNKTDSGVGYVSARKGETYVAMEIGEKSMILNGNTVELDVPAQIINDRTLVPIRAVSEGLDASVKWDSATRTVIIENKKGQHTITSESFNTVLKSSDGRELIDFHYSYPVIANPDNNDFIKELNASFKNEATEFYNKAVNEYLAEAESGYEYRKTLDDFEGTYPCMELTLDYSVTVDRNDILSITNLYYYDFNGAHPTTTKVSKTFDMKGEKQLSLGDIFNGDEKEVESILINSFGPFLDAAFDEEEHKKMVLDEIKKQIENVCFYVDDNGVVAYFQLYEVGPYAMGYPEARVDYDKNADMFKIDLSNYEL